MVINVIEGANFTILIVFLLPLAGSSLLLLCTLDIVHSNSSCGHPLELVNKVVVTMVNCG